MTDTPKRGGRRTPAGGRPPSPDGPYRRYTVSLPIPAIACLRAEAERRGRTPAELARRAIVDWLDALDADGPA